MQQKNLLFLSVVTVAALAVAALALRGKDGGSAATGRARLFPELSAHINEVAEVKIEKGKASATLKKENGQWKLADRGGYPAQFEKVKELAVRIADLEIDEAKTAKKANHAQLAVEWPHTPVAGQEEGSEASEGEEAALVTMKDASGKELAALVVGKSEWQGSKSKVYARRASEDQVYLCAPRGTLEVAPEAKGWIEPKFIELANDRVQDVTIEHADGERVEIGRSAENHTQFKLKNIPPGETERYEGIANGVAQALGYGLQLEDVRPASEVDFSKEPVAKTRFRCVDGLELLVETAKLDDKVWVRISASFTPPPEPPAPSESADSPAADPAAEKPADAPAAEVKPEAEKKDIAKEAADLNQRLAPWAFEVGSYKTDVLARHMKDLLAEPTPPPEGGEMDSGLQGVLDQMGVEDGELAPEVPAPEVVPAPAPDDEGAAPKDGAPNPK